MNPIRYRRQFLKYGFLSLLSFALTNRKPAQSQGTKGKVIVVGAGISGLVAAKNLQAEGFDVTVLEARSRVGGRIWTDRSLNVPFDLGASWIHGPDGNPISRLARQANAKTFLTSDNSVIVYDNQGQIIPDRRLTSSEAEYNQLLRRMENRTENLNRDISFEEAIRRIDPSYLNDLLIRYQLTAYTEFDTGAPIDQLSAWFWQEDEAFPGKDVIIPEGYDAIINLLKKNLDIKTEHIVQGINYQSNPVSVNTNKGVFTAKYVVVTTPLGILKSGTILFQPKLETRLQTAIDRLGMGTTNKVILVFPNAFWNTNIQYFGFTEPTKGKYPYFINTRKFSNVNALITFGFGNYAVAMESQTNPKITDDVMATLRTMFGSGIPSPNQVLVTRWKSDPFARGSYSYMAVGSRPADRAVLGQPVNGRLFFAGEHTSSIYWATVHGAYLTGQRAARQIIAVN